MIKINLLKPIYAAPVNLGSDSIQGVGKFQTGQPESNLGVFISTVVTALTVVSSLAFLLYFILGAFKWITSSGDKGQTEEAKTQMTQAVTGLVVVVVSIFVAGILGGILGVDILNPGKLIGITP